MSTYKIAVIPGDGIGKEVMPEGLRALEAAGVKFGIDYDFTEFGWNCDDYARTGCIMPEDGIEQLRPFDAVFLGAVGMPGVPDHVSLWGMLIPIRREFFQYVNLRPARLLPGVTSPLAGRGPEDIDMMIVRENVEGEYSQIGGRMYEGTDAEMAVQQAVFTRKGCDRVMRYAF
jgi:tartrate dehydrogenase/decarboxylase / D-malate dehydrogenase